MLLDNPPLCALLPPASQSLPPPRREGSCCAAVPVPIPVPVGRWLSPAVAAEKPNETSPRCRARGAGGRASRGAPRPHGLVPPASPKTLLLALTSLGGRKFSAVAPCHQSAFWWLRRMGKVPARGWGTMEGRRWDRDKDRDGDGAPRPAQPVRGAPAQVLALETGPIQHC